MCCFCSPRNATIADSELIKEQYDFFEANERDTRITAIALGLLALFFFFGSFILFGIGTLSPTTLMGLGMLPYLGGAVLSSIGFGMVCGMFLFGIISGVRHCQKEQWQGAWNRLSEKQAV